LFYDATFGYITEAGFEIESIETKCDIDLVDGTILTSHLTVQAKVTGITDDAFQQLVTKAENCPISKVLNAAISSTATLG
jgi:osmotically inducible protein OsmC